MELSVFVNKVKEILINSYTFYYDSEYLSRHTHHGGVPDELMFIHRVKVSQYVVIVIELAKIVVYSDNHHFNIYKLFSAIKNHKKNAATFNFDVSKYENGIKQYSSTIQEIKKLRNKAFAHSDKETLNPGYSFTLTYDQLKDLLDFIVEMINDLSEHFEEVDSVEIVDDKGAEKTYKIVMENI